MRLDKHYRTSTEPHQATIRLVIHISHPMNEPPYTHTHTHTEYTNTHGSSSAMLQSSKSSTQLIDLCSHLFHLTERRTAVTYPYSIFHTPFHSLMVFGIINTNCYTPLC